MFFIRNFVAKLSGELTYLFFFFTRISLLTKINFISHKNLCVKNYLIDHNLFYQITSHSPLYLRKVGVLPHAVSYSAHYNSSANLNKAYFFFGSFFSKQMYVKTVANLAAAYTYILPNLFNFSNFYIKGFVFLLFIDACLTDDEPLWEPIEWSLVQTWILFIFIFAWIAENLIVSRYGSYTGRDKRVWLAWYKSFWMIEGFYVLNYGAVCLCVIVPYYYETNYNLSFVYSWWHWYSRVFFFKFISFFTIILLLANFLQIGFKWLSWQKGFIVALFISFIYSYLLYTQFFITFFSYFTDPVWYQKTRPIDFIQMSHEPSRWGWGPAKKDHFTYHAVKTVFWFKNDGPFAASFLLFQMYLFASIFFAYFYWISLLRRIYSTQEIPATLTTYCTSSLKQFFYFFLFMYFFIFTSYLANYSRLPLEFTYFLDESSWFINFSYILRDYIYFLFYLL